MRLPLSVPVLIEGDDESGFNGYSPDVPGVYATGKTEDIVRERMASGIAYHVDQIRQSGGTVTLSHTKAITLDVAV